MPPAYKEGAPGELPPELDWWRGFKSAELTGLIEEAQRVNLDIAAAAARIMQADASARIAGAPLLPSLTGNGSEQISRRRARPAPAPRPPILRHQIRTYTASLTASYELDFWGKNRDAALAADETATANRFDRDVVALATYASVANTYFTVLATQDRIRIANNNIVSAQRIYDAIKQRVNAGTTTDLELAQQESTLDNLKASVPTLRQTLAQSNYALAVLISRPPESVRIRGGGLGQVALPRVTPGLPSQLLTQRPDIRRQEAQLASATANVGNARAQFFPSIQLTAQGGYQSAALAALFTPQATFYSAAASLTQPIFDGLSIEGNFELQKAKQDELLQTYRKTVIQAFSDVDTALVDHPRDQQPRPPAGADGGGGAAGVRALGAAAQRRHDRHHNCAKYRADAIPGRRFAGSGAARARPGDHQSLSGAGGRLDTDDGRPGGCYLSPTPTATGPMPATARRASPGGRADASSRSSSRC